MPRIPVAAAVLALTVAAVGWNMARYPAVWDMVGPPESRAADSPQSNKRARDRAEARDGYADAAGPQGPAIGSEPAGSQALREASAGGQPSIAIIEPPQDGAFGASSAPTDPQSESATAHAPAAGPTPSALTGTPGAQQARDDSGPGSMAPPGRAALEREPSARVLGVAAVAVSQGSATPQVLPSESLSGPPGGLSSNRPPSGLLRLPPVAAGQAPLPELQWTTPGTPIPVYPSSGID